MSSSPATWSIAARGSQPPCWRCARSSSGSTALACRPGGYLAMICFARSRFSGVKAKLGGLLGDVGSAAHRSISPNTMSMEPMMATASASMWPRQHEVDRLQMGEARRADLAAIGLVAAVGDQIDAELALGRLDRGVGLAGRHVVALGVELEVMDERFHRALHLARAAAARSCGRSTMPARPASRPGTAG